MNGLEPSALLKQVREDRYLFHRLQEKSLGSMVSEAVHAFERITRTWVPDTYRLCPWYIWKECEDNILRFNLIGLVMYAHGITLDPEKETPLIVLGKQHAHQMQRDKTRCRKHRIHDAMVVLGVVQESRAGDLILALDAVRRRDYAVANALHPIGDLDMVREEPPRPYTLGDESAQSPEEFIARLKREIHFLRGLDKLGF